MARVIAARVITVGEGIVIVPPFVPSTGDVAALSDDEWEAAFDTPFEAAVVALGQAKRDGVRRIVVVVPTIAVSGAAHHVATAAAAEALRVTVKSAARQWGPDGVVVNAVAVDPGWFGIDAGVASLAGRALGRAATADDLDPVFAFLTSDAAHHLTGATLTVDGGVQM